MSISRKIILFTFAGALRNGVRELREACPNSLIILMTPPFCAYYSYGTERQSDVGGVLTDYVDAVIRVAESENVVCMNNYEGLGITADNFSDYLADGCHLNETGRYLLGTQIISLVKDHLEDGRN